MKKHSSSTHVLKIKKLDYFKKDKLETLLWALSEFFKNQGFNSEEEECIKIKKRNVTLTINIHELNSLVDLFFKEKEKKD